MATIVCQGLEPMTLRLKLATPKPHCSSLELTFKSRFDQPPNKEPEDARAVSGGGWSFLQALSPLKKDREEVYVHPLVKRIQASLSDESLAMCTENLGSETGSDEMVSDLDTLLSRSTSSEEKRRTKTRKQSGDFPPPLTTISGSECLRLRAHREDGRVVMEAVKSQTCFRSERSHGRLRLYFLQNSIPEVDPHRDQCIHEEEDNDGERVESGSGTMENNQEEMKPQEEETEHGVEVGDGGNNLKLESKMGIECHHGPRRCMEGEIENRKSLNWESFWVATS